MNILGYAKTYRDYLRTEKGARDTKDYAKAAICILVTMLLILAVSIIVNNKNISA